MSQYFSNFPIINYKLPALGERVFATDITKRVVLRDFYRRNFLSYYTYDIQDGERPDNVAYKFYRESTLDWLILLPNEILDPYYQWPLETNRFNDYIRKKYGSVENAMTQIHHYEVITQKRNEITNADGEKILLPEKTLVVDRTTYFENDAANRKLVYAYDYEISLNDKRRNISIIDASYVPSILEAFRNVYR